MHSFNKSHELTICWILRTSDELVNKKNFLLPWILHFSREITNMNTYTSVNKKTIRSCKCFVQSDRIGTSDWLARKILSGKEIFKQIWMTRSQSHENVGKASSRKRKELRHKCISSRNKKGYYPHCSTSPGQFLNWGPFFRPNKSEQNRIAFVWMFVSP